MNLPWCASNTVRITSQGVNSLYMPIPFLLCSDTLSHYKDELYYQVQQRIEEKEEVHMNLW